MEAEDGPEARVECLCCHQMGTAELLGTKRWTEARSVFIAEFQALIEITEPPADVENRFMRLCNIFDDLIGFLSAGALVMVPPPTDLIFSRFFRFSELFENATFGRID